MTSLTGKVNNEEEEEALSQGGGGAHPLHPPPRSTRYMFSFSVIELMYDSHRDEQGNDITDLAVLKDFYDKVETKVED